MKRFQIPESFDAKLQPYLEVGAVFVVIKLLPGQDWNIVPLRLTFSGTRPTIYYPDFSSSNARYGDYRAYAC